MLKWAAKNGKLDPKKAEGFEKFAKKDAAADVKAAALGKLKKELDDCNNG